jgi:hypothetical protein
MTGAGPQGPAPVAWGGSSTDRLVCDLAFLGGLRAACADAYPAGSSLRLTCYAVAGIYFVGVRLFGASFYSGTGSPA